MYILGTDWLEYDICNYGYNVFGTVSVLGIQKINQILISNNNC